MAESKQGVALTLKEFQKKTALLPDYNFKTTGKVEPKEKESPAWPGIEAGTSVAGIAGSIMVLTFIFLVAFGIRLFKKIKP